GVVASTKLVINNLTTVIVIFFFQAEDGIRDATVTGVQTCALPISGERASSARADEARSPASSPHTCQIRAVPNTSPPHFRRRPRSEERRVGKECRSGWVQER